MAKGKRRQK